MTTGTINFRTKKRENSKHNSEMSTKQRFVPSCCKDESRPIWGTDEKFTYIDSLKEFHYLNKVQIKFIPAEGSHNF